MGPDELLSGAEALVPQGHGGVDDILPISTHHYESANTQRHKSQTYPDKTLDLKPPSSM